MNNDLNIRIARAKGYGNPYVNTPNWFEAQNAMELMEEIWEVRPGALMGKCIKTGGNPEYKVRMSEIPGADKFYGDSLSEAICLAWLEIFEKEKK